MIQGINTQEDIRYLRERQIADLTGLSRTTRYRLERNGLFPKRRKLSENRVAWRADEVSDWIHSREFVSDKKAQ